MNPFFGKAGAWLLRRAENFAAGLLAVMFVAFMVQIWGAAFVVKESEEIRFDLVYGAAGPRARRVMGIITGLSIVILYAASLPATVKYVSFMKVEKTSYLKIPFDWLFSIYVFFLVAVVARYLWILSHLLRGKDPEAPDSTKVSSGL